MLERFPEIYDGAVSTLGAGSIDAAIRLHSLYEDCRPAVQPRIAALDDAMRVGGTGMPAHDPGLAALLGGGFPAHSILFLRPNPAGVSLMEYLRFKGDPGWFRDYKSVREETLPGTVRSIDAKSLRLTTDVTRPENSLFCYTVTFTSGAAKGREIIVAGNSGQDLTLSPHGPAGQGVQPGDRFTLSDRVLQAWRAWHKAERPAMEPDRHEGLIKGKMIAVFGADDFNVWPVIGARYHEQVKRALGVAVDDHFRLHFIEHGQHGGVLPNALDRQVPDGLVMYKGLEDLMAWVERGIAPPPGTRYRVDAARQIVLPQSAGERGGYQPVVSLRANGKSDRLEVAAGTEVRFHTDAEDPDNEIVRTEIDFEGDNRFDLQEPARGRRVSIDFTHRYERPEFIFRRFG
jgi:hypothetical protein